VVRQSSAKAPPPVRFWASPPIVLLVLAFLASAIAGPLIGIRLLDAASNAQVRLADARVDLDALLRTQLAEETGVRGYIATRDPQFLEADKPPDPDFDRIALELEGQLRQANLTHGPEVVEDMRALHLQWEQSVALPLMRDPGSRDAYVQQAQGKFLTDAMSRDGAQVRGALTAEGASVRQTLARRINATFAISAGTVTLFAILALWYAIGRTNAISRHLARTQMGFAYASATREALVGGDLLDAWRATEDRGWFLIADASGKGIEAARHAAFAQYAIRALAADNDDPADVLERFNRLFMDTIDDPHVFIVMFLGSFEASTQILSYASAGHATAYVRRGSIVEDLPPTGIIVGVERDANYETHIVPLGVGDVVLLATDGLSEARAPSGEQLGEERIIALLREAPADAQALCDLLVISADDYSGGVQDDLAIVALRVVQHEGIDAAFDAIDPATAPS
jgi:CHASE3 domain sensor protein